MTTILDYNDVRKEDWQWPCINIIRDHWGRENIIPFKKTQKQSSTIFTIIYYNYTIFVELYSRPLIQILQEILIDNNDMPKIKAQDLYHVMEDLEILYNGLETASKFTFEPSVETGNY